MGAQAPVAQPLRVVHDTNVAVSALLFRAGRLTWLRDAWSTGRVVPLVCPATVAELVRVLAYPKFDLAAADVSGVLAHFLEHAETRPDPGARVRVPPCRDEDDRLFLRLAYASDADALVTGDADLVELAPKSRVRVVTPAALHALLESARGVEQPRARYRVKRVPIAPV
ncbi:MAG: putative toxin-antitoxin system toxin component, PIN family [Betaproteobacteria bacterium]